MDRSLRWRVKKAPAVFNAWKVISPAGDTRYEDTFEEALRFADCASRSRWLVLPRVDVDNDPPVLRMGEWDQLQLRAPVREGAPVELVEIEDSWVLNTIRIDPTWLFDLGVALLSMHYYLRGEGRLIPLRVSGILSQEVSFDD